MADNFTVETRAGFRRVEFDADVFRWKDVRVLVDGTAAAEMPMPTDADPYQTTSFDLDGHMLTAIAYRSPLPIDANAQIPLLFDLFAAGRSLTDGSNLADAPTRAARPGRAYPTAFAAIDVALRMWGVVGLSSVGVGVGRSLGRVPLPNLLAMTALLLVAAVVGITVAARVWHRVRDWSDTPRWQRAALGWVAVLGVPLALIALALLVAAPLQGT